MGHYAMVVDGRVRNIAISDDIPPSEAVGDWVDVSSLEGRPGPGWKYENGTFVEPELPSNEHPITSEKPAISSKTEEQKIADATAAAIAKLIADGVLKQA